MAVLTSFLKIGFFIVVSDDTGITDVVSTCLIESEVDCALIRVN